MKLIQKALLIIPAFFLFAQTVTAQSANQDYSGASVYIKYFDRTVYYPNETDSNPVNVHITIKNNGDETLRFKLADDRAFSTDFNVFTV